jgi:nucleoid-associated protein YgaU
MARSRYTYTTRINDSRGIGSWNGSTAIFNAALNGELETTTLVLTQGQRLDHLAGQFYGDGRYWWVIAAASGIGWAPQCPAGTVIKVPKNLTAALGIGK